MSHFAQVINGIVQQVIVAEQDFITSGAVGDPANWIQTSYNTRGCVHYGSDGSPDGGRAVRANFASIDYHYDAQHDVFYAPQPFPSWSLDSNWLWQAPIPYPVGPVVHIWDESAGSWVEYTPA
jgi:hypothetical protein